MSCISLHFADQARYAHTSPKVSSFCRAAATRYRTNIACPARSRPWPLPRILGSQTAETPRPCSWHFVLHTRSIIAQIESVCAAAVVLSSKLSNAQGLSRLMPSTVTRSGTPTLIVQSFLAGIIVFIAIIYPSTHLSPHEVVRLANPAKRISLPRVVCAAPTGFVLVSSFP